MAAAVWKGFVSFGLVSFPVRLQAAARNTPMRFHMLHKKDLSRVKEVFFCQAEDKPLKRDEIVKGYEVSKDEYVSVDQAELDKIAPKTAKVMESLSSSRRSSSIPFIWISPTMCCRTVIWSSPTLYCEKLWKSDRDLRSRSSRCTIGNTS